MTNDAEPLRAFFQTLTAPAAVCDSDLRVQLANEAFERFIGKGALEGKTLAELLQGAALPVAESGDPQAPAEGTTVEVRTEGAHGEPLSLWLSRKGDSVAVWAKEVPWSLGGVVPSGIERRRGDAALLELGREVVLATSEEDLVAVVARGVKGLFPGRMFCLRFVEPKTLTLTSLYAEGALREGARDVLVLKRSALEKTHLSVEGLPASRIRIVEEEVPLLFENTEKGICAPLVASGQLFGVINVEYQDEPSRAVEFDGRLLVQLANQVTVGVRNAKLIEELSFVRKYLEELLEHANALILVADRERRISVFNRQLAAITGYAKEEVLGQDLLRFIPVEERLKLLRVISASLRGEKISNFETRILTRSGQQARVAFSTSSMLDKAGDVEGVIAIGQDVTALRDLETQIIQAEKLSSLGQMAASVVHEINNPMTAVATYADALLDAARVRPNSEADQEKLRKIQQSAQRILKFTRELVAYARPSGEMAAPVDLVAVVELAAGFCEHVLKSHQLRLERTLAQVPTVTGVRGQLVQVFVNLITNAAHATEPEGRIALRAHTENGWAVAEVEDSGSGIAPEHLPHVFEPFFTTKAEGKGTGLGLSIVKEIVEKHGGRLEVESRIGKGTTFTVRLPISEGIKGA